MFMSMFTEAQGLHPDYSARFSNHLLRVLIDLEEKDKNIAISPARLQAVMVMLANWAVPHIQEGILERVGNDVITQEEANALSSKKLFKLSPDDWCNDSEGEVVPTIEQQAIMWVQKDLKVNKAAIENVSDDFALNLKYVDFSTDLSCIIDSAISEATHGLINHLDLELTEDTLALITDILYFKGSWQEEFDESRTREQLFYGTKGKAKVQMMKRTADMQYADTPRCQMVRLPYTCYAKENRRFSMRIYLPKPKYSLQDVLRELWDNEFVCCTEEQEVKLSLPHFSVASSIDMQKLFEELDLGCIYEIADIIPKCIKGLQISQIQQQVKVSVDENGTEAAAVTYMPLCGCCPPEVKPEPVVMTVNRPFIFEIAEDTTNTILFTGVINNVE